MWITIGPAVIDVIPEHLRDGELMQFFRITHDLAHEIHCHLMQGFRGFFKIFFNLLQGKLVIGRLIPVGLTVKGVEMKSHTLRVITPLRTFCCFDTLHESTAVGIARGSLSTETAALSNLSCTGLHLRRAHHYRPCLPRHWCIVSGTESTAVITGFIYRLRTYPVARIGCSTRDRTTGAHWSFLLLLRLLGGRSTTLPVKHLARHITHHQGHKKRTAGVLLRCWLALTSTKIVFTLALVNVLGSNLRMQNLRCLKVRIALLRCNLSHHGRTLFRTAEHHRLRRIFAAAGEHHRG